MRASRLFNVFLLLVPLYFIWSSFHYELRARYIPLLISALVLILQVWVLLGERFPALFRRFDISLLNITGGPDSTGAEVAEALRSSQRGRQVGVMVIWMAVFFLLFYFLGSYPATFGFVLLFLLISGRLSWWVSLGISAGMAGVIFVLFKAMMNFSLFEGVLFGGLVPPF